MLAGYEKHRDTLGFAAEKAGKLKSLLDEEERLNSKQEQLKAEMMKTTKLINDNLVEGRRVYSSMMRFVKGQYGPKSAEVKDFTGGEK